MADTEPERRLLRCNSTSLRSTRSFKTNAGADELGKLPRSWQCTLADLVIRDQQVVPRPAAGCPRLDFRPREVAQALDLKVCDETRRRGEVNCWVVMDGKKLLRITRPQVHRGGSVPRGCTLASIRRATRLNAEARICSSGLSGVRCRAVSTVT